MTKFEVTILGTSSATPAFNRYPSAQIIYINQKMYMVDCGEGAQFQIRRNGIAFNKIDSIFISHLHGDHYLGLVGLLSSMSLVGRILPLNIIGPPDLEKIINLQFNYSQTELSFPITFIPTTADKTTTIFENSEITVETIILSHRIPCTGFLFREKEKPCRIDGNIVKQFNIPPDQIKLIKEGADFELPDGDILPNAVLVNQGDKSRAYAYCSDTRMLPKIVEQIKGVDLLYHEATFLQELHERAAKTFHTTALQAGEIAKMAGAKNLIIGHFSARYEDLTPLLQECKSVFPNTKLAKEGHTYIV